jgi:hypothetical protein
MKLDKLPDRTPVKLSVSFAPDDHSDLVLYADLYAHVYGESAAPADLVPFIVRAFLAGDPAFKRTKKAKVGASEPD